MEAATSVVLRDRGTRPSGRQGYGHRSEM